MTSSSRPQLRLLATSFFLGLALATPALGMQVKKTTRTSFHDLQGGSLFENN